MDKGNSIVRFELNVPTEVALQSTQSVKVQGNYGMQELFTLADGRRMYVTEHVAASIRNSGFLPGMPFTITKLVNQTGRTRYDVNPVTTRPEEIGPALERSIRDFHQIRKGPQSVRMPAAQMERGTGTYGPAPQRQVVPVAAPAPPIKVPANVAFGEIVSFVKSELDARSEQWNDEARQAAVCTMFIEAGKQGWLAPWERAK